MFFKTIKILGIDDSALQHELMKIIFNEPFSGFEYKSCVSFGVASEMSVNDYDVIILDYHSKFCKLDGGQLERILLDEKGYKGTIIFITGNPGTVKSLKEQGKLVIEKPFDVDSLKKIIYEISQGKKSNNLKKRLDDISNISPNMPDFLS